MINFSENAINFGCVEVVGVEVVGGGGYDLDNYGIEWDVTVANPACTRIGSNMELHHFLPVQSKMKRCLLNDDGTVNYYLHPTNSTKKADGSAAVLDGTDGQVMVEIPEFWIKFETDGNLRRCRIAEHEISGYIHSSKCYVSAYEASLQRSTLKLSSVVNMTADFRGGDNKADWDLLSKSQLGMPATNINLPNFRTYARNRGAEGDSKWNCYAYSIHKKLFWLFAVEYATFNSQAAFNAQLTAEGYRQGGLGDGVTTLYQGTWYNYNGFCPVIPCGTTNSLGNTTGVVPYTMPSDYDDSNVEVSVTSYRGVENPFGHIWKWTDGCKLIVQSDSEGGESRVYTCDNPSKYGSIGITDYDLKGMEARTSGYIKDIILGEEGDIICSEIGATSGTNFCDYIDTSIPESGISERGVMLGGSAYRGAIAGLTCACMKYEPNTMSNSFGSRLCYLS